MVRTFYDVLEVPRSASLEEVEVAYRERLKDTHPDVSEAEAADAVKAVIAAGDVLTDEDERERYDRIGHRNYVEATGVYDPSQVRAGPIGRDRPSAEDRATDEPGSTGQSERTSPAGDVDGEDGTAADSADGRRRSASSGDVHTANANPGGVSWATGAAQQHPHETDSGGSHVASTNERAILFLAALVAYPILVFSSVFPPFPLIFRVVIAACTLALLVYLVTVPSVSAPAFGILTLVAGGAVFLLEVPAPSATVLGAVIVTAGPFALTLFVLSARL